MGRPSKVVAKGHPRIICARVAPDLFRKIHLLARARDISVTEIVRMAVRQYISDHVFNDEKVA